MIANEIESLKIKKKEEHIFKIKVKNPQSIDNRLKIFTFLTDNRSQKYISQTTSHKSQLIFSVQLDLYWASRIEHQEGRKKKKRNRGKTW